MNDWIETQCNHENIIKIETPQSVHYAKKICKDCNRFLGWLKKPENMNKRTNTSKYKIDRVIEHHKMKKHYCTFCLREKNNLGKNETLTIDHIQELSIGGEDELYNLQILCTACHSLKNWARLYLNWHLNGKLEEDSETND